MTRRMLRTGLLAITIILAACGPKVPTLDPNAQIRQAVAATVAAIPALPSIPTFPPYPSPTPASLNGLFCEYEFCIGHPPGLAFYDGVAKQNPNSPAASTYENGNLVAYNSTLFIQLFWQYTPGTSDPQFLMDLILEDGQDARVGSFELRLIHNINVLSSPITSTALLPFGGVAGWVCGDRAFAWKVYTPQDGTAETLLQEALAIFRCE